MSSWTLRKHRLKRGKQQKFVWLVLLAVSAPFTMMLSVKLQYDFACWLFKEEGSQKFATLVGIGLQLVGAVFATTWYQTNASKEDV